MYTAWLGIPVAPRALAYGAYIACPILLLTVSRRPTTHVDDPRIVREPPYALRVLGAITVLLVPAALRLLPRLPVPDSAGTDVIKYLGFSTAAWCFLILTPVPRIGYTLQLDRRSAGIAVAAFLAYATVALPTGFGTGFLTWAPHLDARHMLLLPVLLTLTTAVAEELVFRGIVQRWLEVATASFAWGRWAALAGASILFGLAHLPDPRYVALATVAGAVYGLVYQRTGLLLASVITHALVDWTWALFLKG